MSNNELKQFDSKDILSETVDMKQYIEQLVASLRQDKEVYEKIKNLGLTVKEVKSNIGKLADYQEDFNTCKECPGFDACPKSSSHISKYLVKDGTVISVKSEPCHKLIDKMKLDANYIFSDFPDEWKSSRLKSLDLSENRRPIIKEFCSIVKGESNKWLFVNGNHRIGKSYLMVTFANEFVAMNRGKVGIINATSKFKELADLAYSDKDEFKKQFNALCSVPLLVIDCFGEEYKNEFMRDSIIIPMLSERDRNGLLTFFTSDFTINEIQRLYSIGKNSGDIRGKQLGKMLREMCVEEFDLTGAAIYRK